MLSTSAQTLVPTVNLVGNFYAYLVQWGSQYQQWLLPPPPPPSLRKHRLISAPGPGVTVVFLTTVFMVRSLAERDCVPIVEGNRGCVMIVMTLPVHNNIMLGTANHCCLFLCDL